MTLNSQPRKYALFIGRYQTLHEGHKYLFRKKIEEGIPVLVAIREMPIDDKNPFTPTQVMDLFIADDECQKWFSEAMMAMMVIPNIEGVYYGRDVGYNVEQIEVPIDIAAISATKIREQLKIEGKL
jgi:hypothetical protein